MNMSSVKDLFISEPSVSGLWKLNHVELLEVVGHQKLTFPSSIKKDKIRQVILKHLCQDKFISYEEEEEGHDGLKTSSAILELKMLSFKRMRERERMCCI